MHMGDMEIGGRAGKMPRAGGRAGAVDHRAGGRARAMDYSPCDVSDSALGSSGGGGGPEGGLIKGMAEG